MIPERLISLHTAIFQGCGIITDSGVSLTGFSCFYAAHLLMKRIKEQIYKEYCHLTFSMLVFNKFDYVLSSLVVEMYLLKSAADRTANAH